MREELGPSAKPFIAAWPIGRCIPPPSNRCARTRVQFPDPTHLLPRISHSNRTTRSRTGRPTRWTARVGDNTQSRNPVPRMGSQNGQIYLFPGLNQIPAPETNLERDPDRDLVYWSRPFGKPGDTVGSIRRGGHFFTTPKLCKKSEILRKIAPKRGRGGGAHTRSLAHLSARSRSLGFRQKVVALL